MRYLADLASGKHRKLADGNPRWTPSPQFSGDGKWVYFTADGQVHRYPIETPGAGQPITEFTEFAADAQVSPDGKRLAFRRNDEIWMAPLGAHRVRQNETFRLSPRGGHNFAFTPDGTSLVYSTGADVWLRPLKDGGQKQVPIQLKFSTEPPPPVLLRNVRVLDFKVGGFTEGTSLLVEDGRIQWIGSEARHTLPGNLNVVDGGGRFAIPGLFDVHTHTATPIHPQSARDVSRMELWIAYGVTSVGDMGSDLSTLNAWADRRTGFAAPVPRVFSYGSMIEAMPFIWGGSAFIASDEQAREVARVEKEEGAVGLKSYFHLAVVAPSRGSARGGPAGVARPSPRVGPGGSDPGSPPRPRGRGTHASRQHVLRRYPEAFRGDRDALDADLAGRIRAYPRSCAGPDRHDRYGKARL